MLERSAVVLYSISAGAVLAFYLVPFRHAATLVEIDAKAINKNAVAIAEDRRLLRQASALRSLQLRVQETIRSPLQADASGKGQAIFFDRLRTLSQHEGITLTTIVQNEGAQTKATSALANLPISVTAVGKLAGVLRFLSAIDANVGLVDLGRIDIHPTTGARDGVSSVTVRVEGTFLKVREQNASGER